MISLVMATYDDFNGVYFTVQAARLFHGHLINDIVIVDNNPKSLHGGMTENLAKSWGQGIVKYIPYTDCNSTAQTRNLAIRSAKNKRVICTDPHVLFPKNSIQAVIDFFNAGNELDLVHGPMLYDNLVQASTHFDLSVWRGEMWGIWGSDERLALEKPFEIPAQGLGAFATIRDNWIGFHPDFRGFGGEEGYIHEKYRQAGRKVWCVPGFEWLHRFGRPDGVPYPLKRYDKIRNYVIGHKDLGLPLDPIKEHFVGSTFISEMEWDQLKDGKIPDGAGKPGCSSCIGDKFKTLDDWYTFVKNQPSDINEHCETLRKVVAGKRVVDYGYRTNVSSIAIAAGKPSQYTMISDKQPIEWPLLARELKNAKPELRIADNPKGVAFIPECDVVFLDTIHTASYIDKFLEVNAKSVKEWIVIHDSVTFGEQGEDGGPGIMFAVRKFLRMNRNWTVFRHDRNNNGLILLTCVDEYKKELPSKLRQASNFAKFFARHATHVLTGGEAKVSPERYELRLIECDACESRRDNHCGECGCPVEDKAIKEVSFCPLAKWVS